MGTTSLSYSVRRQYIDTFMAQQAVLLPTNAQVLDLGGHKHRKRGYFTIEDYPVRVTYANLLSNKGTDVQADAFHLPFATGSFDVVICAELLEHVPDPLPVLREIFRVLAPHGRAILTVPFLYRIHADPFDFARYTDYYWQTTLATLGFVAIQTERQGLFFAVLVNFVKQYFDLMWRRPFRWPMQWLIYAIQQWAMGQEAKASVAGDAFLASFTTGFGIVATKL